MFTKKTFILSSENTVFEKCFCKIYNEIPCFEFATRGISLFFCAKLQIITI